MISKDSEDYKNLTTAVSLLEAPTLTAKLTDLIGGPVEGALKYLPDGAQNKINDVVKSALHKAADAALWSLENKPKTESSTIFHKVLAATSGAIGGAFGLSAMTIELPISTTIMLRSIADIARHEGFDLEKLETKQTCLEVFAFGSQKNKDAESSYYLMRSFLNEATQSMAKELSEIAAKNAAEAMTANAIKSEASPFISKIIETIASRFGIVITEKTAAQAVPIIGAVTGALLNTMFTDYYQDIAKGYFIMKRLEQKYSSDEVKKHYEIIYSTINNLS